MSYILSVRLFFMEDLLEEFKSVHKDYIDTLKKFPTDNVENVLFDKWTLKEVLAHFTGWDRFFIDSVVLLQKGKKVPYWENMNKYNEKSVEKIKTWSYKKVFDTFVKTGEEFIDIYKNIPDEFVDKLFWDDKNYTPRKFLEINIHHYEKTHLKKIKELLRKWEGE